MFKASALRSAFLRHGPWVVSLALLGLLSLLWWSTAVSTSQARILALRPVEGQAFAVYQQVIRNLAFEGEVFQTIHRGYDDRWTWSGHRSLTLFPVAGLYRLAPGALELARLQLGLVLLGVIPAVLLGRRRAGQLGGFFGGALYLLMPSTLFLALQDYQDLVLCLPALVFCAWCLGTGRWAWVLVGAVVGMAPREECLAVVVALAVACPPEGTTPRKPWRWLLQVLLVTALALGLAWGLRADALSSEARYTPSAANAVSDLTVGRDVVLWGWTERFGLYLDIWSPAGLLAVFAPVSALAALSLELLHMTLPWGAGIDRNWGGHAHHLAPAAALAMVATITGGGRVLGFLGRRGTPGRAVALFLALLALGTTAHLAQERARELSVRVVLWPVAAEWEHPAWRLARLLPDDAVPVTSRITSLTVAHRRVAYTFDESLALKSGGRGLGVATHLLVSSDCTELVGRALAMEGAEVLATDGDFELITWTPGARDALATPNQPGTRTPPATCRDSERSLGPYRDAGDIPGVPSSKRETPPARGSLPHISVPRWLRSWL